MIYPRQPVPVRHAFSVELLVAITECRFRPHCMWFLEWGSPGGPPIWYRKTGHRNTGAPYFGLEKGGRLATPIWHGLALNFSQKKSLFRILHCIISASASLAQLQINSLVHSPYFRFTSNCIKLSLPTHTRIAMVTLSSVCVGKHATH